MKIRADFVTNSSSSSFIAINLESQKIADILNSFRDAMKNSKADRYIADSITVDGKNVSIEIEGNFTDVPMENKNIVYSMVESLDIHELLDSKKVGDKYVDFVNTEYTNYPEDEIPSIKLMQELLDRQDELLEDIDSCHFGYKEINWGGDIDTIKYFSSYTDEYKLEVAKSLGYSTIEEMPRNEFFDFIDIHSSESLETYDYKKGEDGIYNQQFHFE